MALYGYSGGERGRVGLYLDNHYRKSSKVRKQRREEGGGGKKYTAL